jgi:GNAT superfamily N-acetyltransferase
MGQTGFSSSTQPPNLVNLEEGNHTLLLPQERRRGVAKHTLTHLKKQTLKPGFLTLQAQGLKPGRFQANYLYESTGFST